MRNLASTATRARQITALINVEAYLVSDIMQIHITISNTAVFHGTIGIFFCAISSCKPFAVLQFQMSSNELNDKILPTVTGNHAAHLHKKQFPLVSMLTTFDGTSHEDIIGA